MKLFSWSPCPHVAQSPSRSWGGEENLRFYPNQPGLPRKPIPSLKSPESLKATYAIKNANFPAFFNNLIFIAQFVIACMGKTTGSTGSTGISQAER
jgi:hypothetical protein